MEIKVFLDPHETEQDAQDALFKAVTMHAEDPKGFSQPGARAVYEEMTRLHDAAWAKMLKNIFAVIDDEI